MSITVGQIGLGVLGSAMAPNIMKSGFSLIGYDVRAVAVEEMAAAGMIAATETPCGIGKMLTMALPRALRPPGGKRQVLSL